MACLPKCPGYVGELKRIEVAEARLCDPCQHLEQLRVLLARLCKCPYCVGELLRFETTAPRDAPRDHRRQHHKQLRILMACLRKCPGYVDRSLHVGIANVPL